MSAEELENESDIIRMMREELIGTAITKFSVNYYVTEEELIDHGWRGLNTRLSISDEWAGPLGYPSFTPAEFNEMWESFSHDEQIEYVLSLIT